jgi:hypothetical protein
VGQGSRENPQPGYKVTLGGIVHGQVMTQAAESRTGTAFAIAAMIEIEMRRTSKQRTRVEF